jgi:hypothetical protein
MGIAALTDKTSYLLCLRYPEGSEECVDFPLSEPDPEYGFRQSAVVCYAPIAGVYTVSWSLGQFELEPSLSTPRLKAEPDYAGCIAEPAPQGAAGREPAGSARLRPLLPELG